MSQPPRPRPVPCVYLTVPPAGQAAPWCHLALPLDCPTCPSYATADDERTRCEVWTRVMGYHRPVSAFNAGKQAEHAERVAFSEQPTGAGRRRPNTAYAEGAGHD